jgi:DNA topoisomerase-3
VPTPNGIQLIEIVHEKLKKPDLTGEWESELGKIAKDESSSKDFIVGIKKYVNEIIIEGKRSPLSNIKFAEIESKNKSKRESIGICPRCGREVYENQRSFYCSGYKNSPPCRFSMWKEDKTLIENGAILTKKIAAELLQHGKSEIEMSKDGQKSNAVMRMNDSGRYVTYTFEVNK